MTTGTTTKATTTSTHPVSRGGGVFFGFGVTAIPPDWQSDRGGVQMKPDHTDFIGHVVVAVGTTLFAFFVAMGVLVG